MSITKEKLSSLLNSSLKIEDIVKQLQISTYAFYKLLKKYNLQRKVKVDKLDNKYLQQVDLSKLSRDYQTHPLHKGEVPKEEDLRYLYLTLNWDRITVAKYLGSGNSKKTVAKFLKKYNISKEDKLFRECWKANYYTKHPESLKKHKKPTLQERGYKNGRQLHIPLESLDVLYNKNKLAELYKKHSAKEIAKLLGVSDVTVGHYLVKHGIEIVPTRYTSSAEKEIISLFPGISFKKDRTILDGQEIDLYSDIHKIGIEFNGNYWHSDACKVAPDYHKKKSDLAAAKGVFLFHIFEYEWLNPVTKAAIINRLHNLFITNMKKVYARKCIIKDVPVQEATDFLNKNHTQGRAPSQIRLGLYNGTELVALMEFITNGINKKYQYELSRFCCKAGYNVVGGASKLFKYFIKTYNPENIISYSDIAKTTGNIYSLLGFIQDSITKPQYHWTNGDITLTRYQCQLKRLTKLGWRKGTETEVEVMTSKGFHKIYDCGKIVWIWKRGE